MTLSRSTVELTRRERALVLSVIGILCLEIVVIAPLALRRDLPSLVVLAPGIDALLLAGGVLWLIARRTTLRALGVTPRRMARLIGLALLGAGLGSRALGLTQARQLFSVAALCEVAIVAAIALGLRRGVDSWMPKPVVTALRAEIAVAAAAGRSLARRPIEQRAGAFSTTATSRVGAVVATLVLLSLFEAPALHLLLHASRWTTHLAIAAVHLYGLCWLVGDRRLMQETGHRITDHALEIALGHRLRGRVAWRNLASVSRCDGERMPHALRITPSDPANVAIDLVDETSFTSYFGIRRRAARLQLFVDEPDRFIAEIARMSTRARQG